MGGRILVRRMDWNEDYDEKEGNRRIYLGREEKEKI